MKGTQGWELVILIQQMDYIADILVDSEYNIEHRFQEDIVSHQLFFQTHQPESVCFSRAPLPA